MQVLEISPHKTDSQEHAAALKLFNTEEMELLQRALGDLILVETVQDHPDETKLEQAFELKNQITDDFIKLHDTADLELPRVYEIEEKTLISDALKAMKQRDQELLITTSSTEYNWLYDANETEPVAETARFYGQTRY